MTRHDKVFIVTGGLGSIGSAAARMLTETGASVMITDIVEDGGEGLATELAGSCGRAAFFQADLAEEGQVRTLVEHTLARFGRLDGAFNNAGVEQPRKPLVELESEEWARIMRINVQGLFHCIKHQFLAMRDGGAIVNTSSGLGVVGSLHAAAYVASKHAVCGLTRAAAVEGGPRGIRVNAILPGTIRTPMFERVYAAPEFADALALRHRQHFVGRLGLPEDIGFLARWLLSDEAAFVTGALYAADGGFTAT